jgi:hypothetical protein
MKYFSTRGGDERLTFEEVRRGLHSHRERGRSQSKLDDDGEGERRREWGRAPVGLVELCRLAGGQQMQRERRRLIEREVGWMEMLRLNEQGDGAGEGVGALSEESATLRDSRRGPLLSSRCFRSQPADPHLVFISQAVLRGLAPNGGLYIPAHLPSLPENWEHDWAKLSFTELALELYSLFISEEEIPRADLKDLIDRSYATFRHEQVTPLHRTGEKEFILELFHGPTFAFKDVALQFLGNLFEYFLKRRNEGKSDDDRERLTVVGATSGDTGSCVFPSFLSFLSFPLTLPYPQRRNLRSPVEAGHLHLHPPPQGSRFPHSGGSDDDRPGRERLQPCC